MFRAARAAAFARINNYASPWNKEVFKIRVDMRAGETRLIKSKLRVTANPKMTDSLVVVGHRLVCRRRSSARSRACRSWCTSRG